MIGFLSISMCPENNSPNLAKLPSLLWSAFFHILTFLETLSLKTSLYILGGGIFLKLITPVLLYT